MTRTAVLVPCRDEATTIAKVVADFRAALPDAEVYAYDNASTDATAEKARAAGAIVGFEPRPGKGNVVRRMLADIEADVYVLVDGDDTYDAAAAGPMVKRLVEEQLDMVVGRRRAVEGAGNPYRRGHGAGNRIFNRVLRALFGGEFTDLFSGYRVMSRRFVKSFPGTSSGFEIETEMTAHAVDLAAPSVEVDVDYRARAAESSSKLRTFRDGWRILFRSLLLYKEMRPMRFFCIVSLLLTLVAVGLAIPILAEYLDTGLVPRFPTAILAAAIEIVALVCLTSGFVLDTVGRFRREAKRLAYLAIPRTADDASPGSQ